jgi:hypothetical protein
MQITGPAPSNIIKQAARSDRFACPRVIAELDNLLPQHHLTMQATFRYPASVAVQQTRVAVEHPTTHPDKDETPRNHSSAVTSIFDSRWITQFLAATMKPATSTEESPEHLRLAAPQFPQKIGCSRTWGHRTAYPTPTSGASVIPTGVDSTWRRYTVARPDFQESTFATKKGASSGCLARSPGMLLDPVHPG